MNQKIVQMNQNIVHEPKKGSNEQRKVQMNKKQFNIFILYYFRVRLG